MTPTPPPQPFPPVNWAAVLAVLGASLVLITALAVMAGFWHARNWGGVAAVIGGVALLIITGLAVERAGLRSRRQ